MGWYIVIKTIKGRKYRYRQRTWREGGRVRTQSFSLGPVGADEAPARAGARAEITIDPRAKALVKEHLMPVFMALRDQRNVIPQREAPWDPAEPSPGTFRKIPELDALIKASGARIGLDHDEAKFSIDADLIVLPEARTFRERPFLSATEGYYTTLLHEMAHWTGSAKRLDRFERAGDRRITRNYAREELVAEATAIIVMKAMGFTPRSLGASATYFRFWFNVSGDAEECLLYAMDETEKAAELLLTFGLNRPKQTVIQSGHGKDWGPF